LTDRRHVYERASELYSRIDRYLMDEDFNAIDNVLACVDYEHDDLVYCLGAVRYTYTLRDKLFRWRMHILTLRDRDDCNDDLLHGLIDD
jgi:hypothetical protein